MKGQSRVAIRELPFVTVYATVPIQETPADNRLYAHSLPADAKYDVEISLLKPNENVPHALHKYPHNLQKIPPHTAQKGITKSENSMFRCVIHCITFDKNPHLFSVNSEKFPTFFVGFPSKIDCDRCGLACRGGFLRSRVEYGVYGRAHRCLKCGEVFEGYVEYGKPCVKCGGEIRPVVRGKPHIHGKEWVFELHVLDREVSDLLGLFLGDLDKLRHLGFSCKGSWHNFRNVQSGFDVCHVSCLNSLISARLSSGLKGLPLFKKLYPEEGKVWDGHRRVVAYWKNGESLDPSEYFVEHGKGIPVRRGE